MLRNDDLSCESSFIFSILFTSCACLSTFLSLNFDAWVVLYGMAFLSDCFRWIPKH